MGIVLVYFLPAGFGGNAWSNYRLELPRLRCWSRTFQRRRYSPCTIDVVLALNVNLSRRITNTATMATESLLLIDDPKPGVANTSDGFPYFGLMLGTPGILAGASGSGNVYRGRRRCRAEW
jgi:hypothetical protein